MFKRKYLVLIFILLTACSKGQTTANDNSQIQQEQIISRITALTSTRPNAHPKKPEDKAIYDAYLEKESALKKELMGIKVQNWTCTVGEIGAPVDLIARLTHLSDMEHLESKFDCFGNKDHRISGVSKNLDNQIFSIVLNENDARKIGKLNKGDQVRFSGALAALNFGLRLEFIMEFQQVNVESIK